MNSIPPIEFKVYKDKRAYDKIIRSIKGIPRKVSARQINKIICSKFNFGLIPIIALSKESINLMPIFRVRCIKEGEYIDETKESSFSYPPKNKVKMARVNRNNQQVFYACSDHRGAFYECEKQIKKNNKRDKNKSIAYLSIWKVKDFTDNVNMRILSLGIKGKNDGTEASIFFDYINERIDQMLKNSNHEKFKTNFLYSQKLYTELFLNKGSRYYHITSAMAYNTFVHSLEQKVDIPIISYPSVAVNHGAINFAFRRDFVDKHLYIKEIYKVQIHEISDGKLNLTYLAKGIKENNRIKWSKIGYKVESIGFEDAILLHKVDDEPRKIESDDFITDMETNYKMTLPQYFKYASITNDMMVELADKPNRPSIGKIYDILFTIETNDRIKITNAMGNVKPIHSILFTAQISYGAIE